MSAFQVCETKKLSNSGKGSAGAGEHHLPQNINFVEVEGQRGVRKCILWPSALCTVFFEENKTNFKNQYFLRVIYVFKIANGFGQILGVILGGIIFLVIFFGL